MTITRRQALQLIGLAGAAPVAIPAASQRRVPMICVYSGSMTGMGYPEIGEIASQLGFEGVDLTVFEGGQVDPPQSPVDLVRAVETVTSAGLTIPVISTILTTPADPWARTVVALSGGSGIQVFKTGIWRSSILTQDAQIRALLQKREVSGLAVMGRQYGCAMALTTRAGESDMIDRWPSLIGNLDPQWAGLALDSALPSLSPAALSRALAVTLRDYAWVSKGGTKVREWKPLGQGEVDFAALFDGLARAHFTGPVSIERNYAAKDEPGALARDAAFVRKHLEGAYAAPRT